MKNTIRNTNAMNITTKPRVMTQEKKNMRQTNTKIRKKEHETNKHKNKKNKKVGPNESI